MGYSDEEPVDFVLCWVDGSDPAWQAKRARFLSNPMADAGIERYRDWGLLRYWFRAVWRFAPWVRHIYFVTNGQLPLWLRKDAPRLRLVRHDEYIPQQWLPTFNSHTIELNFHRLPGLAEQFVYFNDDMFLLRPVAQTDFFVHGRPLETYGAGCLYFGREDIGHQAGADLAVINTCFSKRRAMLKNAGKWLSLRNGAVALTKTLLLAPWPFFTGFDTPHLPSALLKSTLQTVWHTVSQQLADSCGHRFREKADVNQWVFGYWQLAQGLALPAPAGRGRCLALNAKTIDTAQRLVRRQVVSLLCLNDSPRTDYAALRPRLVAAFDEILPQRSPFELW